MAMEYCCGSAAKISAQAGRHLLVRELKLAISDDSPFWIYNAGVMVMLRDYGSTKASDTETEIAGFEPHWGMRMRMAFTSKADQLELGCRTMLRVVDCLMRFTTEDIYFSKEWERLLIFRQGGRVQVRDNFDYYMSESYLSDLSVPYEVGKLKP
jgi:hypothetical protein